MPRMSNDKLNLRFNKSTLFCVNGWMWPIYMWNRPPLWFNFRRRQWHPTPVLLPGKSHGWRSLEGCSPGVAEGRTWLIDFTFTFHFYALEKEMATHSSVLAWRILGTGHPGGLPSMGLHRVGHNWSDSAAAAAWFNFRGTRDPGAPYIFPPYSIVP